MAIYLGGQRVSPSLNTIIEKTITITKDTNGNIISTDETLTISNTTLIEDPDNLSNNLPVISNWTRPSSWPNLDVLPALDEGVYLTYDNTSRVDYKWACFYCDVQSSGQVTIAQGHMNGNTWVQDTTVNVNTATYKEINYGAAAPANTDYVVFKITPTTATKHMTSMYFGRITTGNIGTIVTKWQLDLYCLERIGKLPYLVSTIGDGNNRRFCTLWMKHDNIEFGNTVSSLANAWCWGRSLQKIEWGNWTGEYCNITTLAYTFAYCNNIEKIDLSLWNTTNWHVTTINNMFDSCYSLKECIVPFNTTNWGNGTGKTFTMQLVWANCMALENLNLNSWNMSNLNVTIIYLCWYNCYHLKSLKVNTWNTSKWKVNGTNGLYHLFSGCRLLVDIDLSGWDTSNWEPIRADCIFYYNQKRRNFDDIKNWDTSKWKIALFNSAFNGCHRILELDLRNWDTSSWVVTSLEYTFANCQSLRHIKVGTWDTSGWKVTNINYLCLNDYNLEDADFWNWNTGNWLVTNGLYQMFYYCYRLKEIDFSHWTTTNWALTAGSSKCDIRYFANQCFNVKKIDLSPFNINVINSLDLYAGSASGTRSYSPFYYCYNLEELTLPQNYRGHIDLSEAYKLSRLEFVKIFNALSSSPIGTTAKVWVISTKYKLTTADIAIATNKGYTVVQS